jgi:hypothetical protein
LLLARKFKIHHSLCANACSTAAWGAARAAPGGSFEPPVQTFELQVQTLNCLFTPVQVSESLQYCGFSAVLDRKWPLDRAGRRKLYRSGQGALRSDLQLGSVSKHHPDAMTSIAKFQFDQSREIDLAIFFDCEVSS